MDCYDAAAWSAISGLSEMSIARGGACRLPGFHRGQWIHRKPHRFVINFHKILGWMSVKGILSFYIHFLVSSSIMIIFVTQVNLFYLNFKLYYEDKQKTS